MENTRSIIPVEHEQAESQKTTAESGFQIFLNEFTIDDMPACPVGMRMLYDFGISNPTLYRMAERSGFQSVPPPVTKSVKWTAYAMHVQACYDCNESGSSTL